MKHVKQNEDLYPIEQNEDYCDLDPSKICDNCCKCLEPDAEYRSVLAELLLHEDADALPAEEEDYSAEDIPPLEIDPKLLAEWEDKLKDIE